MSVHARMAIENVLNVTDEEECAEHFNEKEALFEGVAEKPIDTI